MLLLQSNGSDDVEASHVVPEPQPDWSEAIRAWGVAWSLHIYGFGAVYALLTVYCLYSIARLRRKLLSQQHVVGIASSVVAMSLFRICFLVVDPYQSRDVLPAVVVRMLNALVYPCLIAMFTLLQVIIVKFTKVGAERKSSLRTHRMLVASIAAYFLSTAAITLIVAWNVELKFLILFVQGVFISWGLIVCFSFVYNGFKVAQFTSEANRALREFTRYSRVRKEALRSGKPRDLALHRITRPRMRDEAEMLPMEVDASYESGDESSDSISFFNEAFGESSGYEIATVQDRERRRRREARATAVGQEPSKSARSPASSTSAEVSGADSSSDGDRDPDERTDSLEQRAPPVRAEGALPVGRHKSGTSGDRSAGERWRESTTDADERRFRIGKSTLSALASCLPIQNGMLRTNVAATTTDSLLVQTNKAFDLGSSSAVGKSADADPGAESAPFVDDPEGVAPAKELDPGDGGYMADTEPNSPQIVPGRHRSGRPKPPIALSSDAVDSVLDSPRHAPYPLPLNDGSMGLYRILQGRALGRVHKVVYFATLFVFITCIMKLYAMFGVYGVLTRDTTAEMWPWFVFNTCARFSELGAAFLISWVTFTLARKRWRIRRKRKLRTKEMTTC